MQSFKKKKKVEHLKSSDFVQGTGHAGWTVFFFLVWPMLPAYSLKPYEISYRVTDGPDSTIY